MNKPFLDDSTTRTFNTQSQNFELKLKEVKFNMDQVEQIADEIKDGKASDQMIHQYNVCLKKLTSLFKELEHMLTILDGNAENSKQEGIADKLRRAYKQEHEEYSRCLSEYEILSKNKSLRTRMDRVGDDSRTGSVLDSVLDPYQGQHMEDDMIPATKVYDQEKFIQQRNEKIVNIKTEAKGLNDLAVVIHDKVEEGGYKLDALNKNLEGGVKEIKQANRELAQAREIGSKQNKNSCVMVLLIIVLLAALGVTIAVVYKYI